MLVLPVVTFRIAKYHFIHSRPNGTFIFREFIFKRMLLHRRFNNSVIDQMEVLVSESIILQCLFNAPVKHEI
jgi:hypothetical protein